MTSTGSIIVRLLASSAAVAGKAGRIVRDVMNKGELGIVEKGKDDYQTEADRAAQKCIIGSLSALYPKITIIGEEENIESELNTSDILIEDLDKDLLKLECPSNLKDVKEDDIVVWVDPLDGTSEYTQGFLEHVTVLIGIAVNDKPVAGVIHQPYFKKTIEGANKMGRTIWGLQDVGVGGLTVAPPPDSLVVTTTRSHSNPLVEQALEAMNASKIIRVGGAGYKVLQLLEGEASVYLFASGGCKKWDTCACEAVLRAAGGALTDVRGRRYPYGRRAPRPNAAGVLAAATLPLHEYALQRLPPHLKEQLC